MNQDCNELTSWHLPWNKNKYKKKCTQKKCVWEKTIFGSTCQEPITVTERNIQRANLKDEIYLATLSKFELKKILKKCNKADEKYLEKIIKQFSKKRISIIRDIVNKNILNYLMVCTEDELLKIVKNAKNEKKIKKLKNLSELTLNREKLQNDCFKSKLGYKKKKYHYHNLDDIKEKLKKCGIESNNTKYLIALNMWDTRNRPNFNNSIKFTKKLSI